MSRGKYYLTPFYHEHIDEFAELMSEENIREIMLLGHSSVHEALEKMVNKSEAYLARETGGNIIFVGGLWHHDDIDHPQMFALFTKEIKDNMAVLARGSKMLINFFDQTEAKMCMTILAEHESMLNWAAWLGFEPVGIIGDDNTPYVEFVRCNPNQKNVSHNTSRPVKH